MRITRAAKVAAFPLIVLALVALVACQGGPGTKGDKGDTGDMGTMGVPGTNAPIPLTGRVGPVLIESFNAGKDMKEATEFMIDLHAMGYFNGGEAPFKYKVTSVTDSDATGTAITDDVGKEDSPVATAEIDEDTNMLKIELRAAHAFIDDDGRDYMKGFTIGLSANDANKERATSSLVIRPNRPPRLASGVGKVADTDSDSLTGENEAFIVGIMDGEIDTDDTAPGKQPRPTGSVTANEAVGQCATMNSCVLDLFDDDGDDDDGDYEVAVTSDLGGSYTWSNEKGKLKLTGLSQTKDPVDVDVTATDKGGLMLDVRFTLKVNGPPTLSDNAAGIDRSITIPVNPASGVTLELFASQAAAMMAFADPDMDTVAVAFESKNEAVVVVSKGDGGEDDGGTLTPKSRGTATIVATGITGTVGAGAGGLGQYTTIEFTVTVE